MNHHVKRRNRRSRLHLVFMTLVALMIGCASTVPPQQPEATPVPTAAPAPQKKMIVGIEAMEDAERVQVKISANRTLTYTSVKQPHPLGVVLYFPETGLAPDVPGQLPGNAVLSGIQATELSSGGQTSRIEMVLKSDAVYSVNRQNEGLIVSFAKPVAMEKPSEASAKPLSDEVVPPLPIPTDASAVAPDHLRLHGVSTAVVGQSTLVTVRADGEITNYRSFTLENPPRIVFELFNIKSLQKGEQVVSVGSPWVKKLRYYSYPEKTRLVVDTTATSLSQFGAWPVASGLTIRVGDDGKKFPGDVAAEALRPTPVSKEVPIRIAVNESWVNRIDFAGGEEGKSTILIGTTEPVAYKIKKAGDRLLHLSLNNARLPDYRERPLITTRFQSAVDRIIPSQMPGAPEKTLFTIELRESVPYFVEQQDRLLLVHFEASSASPKPYDKKAMPAWKTVLETAKGPTARSDGETVNIEGQKTEYTPNIFSGKTYSGEKIALDFFETDIKNVFRIFKEVSGKNFAIDKDVGGKVTLSFDKPVPWDQVLDLVLKMNQLGKVIDGDIVRIATLSTLKKEEDDRQAVMVARQKAAEQEKALEPLVTEYIRINYANAKDEVLPHIEKIITEERGNVTVDDRSNQIIITDTAAKIEQAKAMVKRLDNVTPQVIIEARIVEVTSNFSNEMGISWTAQADNINRNDLGGLVGWDVAMNFPVAGGSGIGFNFERIAGTPLLLDARLSAIETKGQAKIISAPKIVTLDNKKAKIKQGLEVAYLERDDAGGSSVKFKSVDLLLEVTPHVTPDQRVSMSIYITKNDVNDIVDGVPVLGTNEAETELLVNDGDTIVIGGILKRSKSTGASEFPGLASIPIVSWLFKKKNQVDDTGELLIFITPQIVQLAQR